MMPVVRAWFMLRDLCWRYLHIPWGRMSRLMTIDGRATASYPDALRELHAKQQAEREVNAALTAMTQAQNGLDTPGIRYPGRARGDG